jgi:phospholipid transport system substrate-binding protein
MRQIVIALFSLLFTTLLHAAAPALPTEVIQGAIHDVASEMKKNAALYEKDKMKLQEMVLGRADNYFNFTRMAQLAMGRHGKTATPEQRTAIIREYRIQFTRSYANTLFEYRNVNPEILLQPDSNESKATVKMNVKSDKGEATTLFLRLEKSGDSWKIIDVTAEGVSLVITARSQFDEIINKEGIDGLIKSLAEENRKKSP